MLHDNMEIFCLMVHVQQNEERILKRTNRDAYRARSNDGGTSMGKFEIQENPKFKKRISKQVPSN